MSADTTYRTTVTVSERSFERFVPFATSMIQATSYIISYTRHRRANITDAICDVMWELYETINATLTVVTPQSFIYAPTRGGEPTYPRYVRGLLLWGIYQEVIWLSTKTHVTMEHEGRVGYYTTAWLGEIYGLAEFDDQSIETSTMCCSSSQFERAGLRVPN